MENSPSPEIQENSYLHRVPEVCTSIASQKSGMENSAPVSLPLSEIHPIASQKSGMENSAPVSRNPPYRVPEVWYGELPVSRNPGELLPP